jgi:pilus assembly protein Flp/PilA
LLKFVSGEVAMERAVRRLWLDEGGSDASEYALLAALVALAIVGGASTLGASVAQMIEGVADYVPAYPGS